MTIEFDSFSFLFFFLKYKKIEVRDLQESTITAIAQRHDQVDSSQQTRLVSTEPIMLIVKLLREKKDRWLVCLIVELL